METFVPSLTAEPRRRWEFSLLGKKTLRRRVVAVRLKFWEVHVKRMSSLLAVALLAMVPDALGQTVVFENVNVIPMDRERVLERQTVIVRDGRIAQIGPAAGQRRPPERRAWMEPANICCLASPRCTAT